MRLNALTFTHHPDTPRAWHLDALPLQDFNLVVGISASGKSKAILAVTDLARCITGRSRASSAGSADYHAEFDHDGKRLKYTVKFRDDNVFEEQLEENGVTRMWRGAGGVGAMDGDQPDDRLLSIDAHETQAAVAVPKTSTQNACFDALRRWARSVYSFPFNTALGQSVFAVPADETLSPELADPELVVPVFLAARRKLGPSFADALKADMESVGFPLEEVGVTYVRSVPVEGQAMCLFIKEQGASWSLEQTEMSIGMFRALSLLIQVNFLCLTARPRCIVVDDAGEGLDFGRACALIALLREKAAACGTQLIMASNDRFLLNKVGAPAWNVLPINSYLRTYRTAQPIQL